MVRPNGAPLARSVAEIRWMLAEETGASPAPIRVYADVLGRATIFGSLPHSGTAVLTARTPDGGRFTGTLTLPLSRSVRHAVEMTPDPQKTSDRRRE